ncbi:MAG TPA: hypothetical protein VMB74_01760 [Streptosporangiaceae bacterium]|nr:hypothetical protein [Streptosporangiaceae bacterium]
MLSRNAARASASTAATALRSSGNPALRAYAWVRAMDAEGITEAAELSVLASNYMNAELMTIRGVTRSSRRDVVEGRH